MQRVIIVGGGYGGLRAVEKLSKNKKIEIYLIDKNRFHYFQTEAYKFLSGRQNIKDTTSDLSNFCNHFCNVKFIEDEAIDIKKSLLICKKNSYSFDKLIIAVGAKDFIPKNLEKYSYKIKDINSAFRFKQKFIYSLYEDVTKKRALKIVIGRAGQSGVELAGELMCIAKECESKAWQETKIKVYLIEAQSSILPNSSSYLIEKSCKRLKELGVKIYTDSLIEDIDKKHIYLKDKTLEYDMFIFLGGITPNTFIKNLKYKKDKRGFLEVNNYLQIDKNIYAIGDCAKIYDINGKILAPTAQLAEQSAEYVAKLISNSYNKPFNGKIYGTFIEIGKKYAVGELFSKIHINGYFAYLIKLLITKLYSYGIKIKTNSGYSKQV